MTGEKGDKVVIKGADNFLGLHVKNPITVSSLKCLLWEITDCILLLRKCRNIYGLVKGDVLFILVCNAGGSNALYCRYTLQTEPILQTRTLICHK